MGQLMVQCLLGQTHHCCGPQSHCRAGTGWQHLVGIAGLTPLCLHQTHPLSRQEQVGKVLSACHPARLGQFLLAGSVAPTREIIFLSISQEVKTEALEETVAVRLHAFSIRTGNHRGHVHMGGLSLSLGPIHLSFLAFPLCPTPFFQLPIHLPVATRQPLVAPQCSHEDLGRAAPSSWLSHADGEEQSLGKSSSWDIPALVQDVPCGTHHRGEAGDRWSPRLSLPLVSWCILSTVAKQQKGLFGRAG